jgi:hypothetical protein
MSILITYLWCLQYICGKGENNDKEEKNSSKTLDIFKYHRK